MHETPKTTLVPFAVALTLTLAPACVVDGGFEDDPEAEMSGTTGPDPSDNERCPELASYELALAQGVAEYRPSGPERIALVATVSGADVEPLDIFVNLLSGRGALAAGYRPGTFAIAGAEADIADCGVCVFFGRRNAAGEVDKVIFAESGTVQITAVDPPSGKLTGAVTGATLREIDLDTGADVPGGCTTAIGSYTFDADIVSPDAGGTPPDDSQIPPSQPECNAFLAIDGDVKRVHCVPDASGATCACYRNDQLVDTCWQPGSATCSVTSGCCDFGS